SSYGMRVWADDVLMSGGGWINAPTFGGPSRQLLRVQSVAANGNYVELKGVMPAPGRAGTANWNLLVNTSRGVAIWSITSGSPGSSPMVGRARLNIIP